MPYPIVNNQAGGLLRGLTQQKVQGPAQEAGFDPAAAELVREPLRREKPPGTSEVISNAPPLEFSQVEQMLEAVPPPPPDVAARLIAALVRPPSRGKAAQGPRGQAASIAARQGFAPAGGTVNRARQAPIIPQGTIRAVNRPGIVGGPLATGLAQSQTGFNNPSLAQALSLLAMLGNSLGSFFSLPFGSGNLQQPSNVAGRSARRR